MDTGEYIQDTHRLVIEDTRPNSVASPPLIAFILNDLLKSDYYDVGDGVTLPKTERACAHAILASVNGACYVITNMLSKDGYDVGVYGSGVTHVPSGAKFICPMARDVYNTKRFVQAFPGAKVLPYDADATYVPVTTTGKFRNFKVTWYYTSNIRTSASIVNMSGKAFFHPKDVFLAVRHRKGSPFYHEKDEMEWEHFDLCNDNYLSCVTYSSPITKEPVITLYYSNFLNLKPTHSVKIHNHFDVVMTSVADFRPQYSTFLHGGVTDPSLYPDGIEKQVVIPPPLGWVSRRYSPISRRTIMHNAKGNLITTLEYHPKMTKDKEEIPITPNDPAELEKVYGQRMFASVPFHHYSLSQAKFPSSNTNYYAEVEGTYSIDPILGWTPDNGCVSSYKSVMKVRPYQPLNDAYSQHVALMTNSEHNVVSWDEYIEAGEFNEPVTKDDYINYYWNVVWHPEYIYGPGAVFSPILSTIGIFFSVTLSLLFLLASISYVNGVGLVTIGSTIGAATLWYNLVFPHFIAMVRYGNPSYRHHLQYRMKVSPLPPDSYIRVPSEPNVEGGCWLHIYALSAAMGNEVVGGDGIEAMKLLYNNKIPYVVQSYTKQGYYEFSGNGFDTSKQTLVIMFSSTPGSVGSHVQLVTYIPPPEYDSTTEEEIEFNKELLSAFEQWLALFHQTNGLTPDHHPIVRELHNGDLGICEVWSIGNQKSYIPCLPDAAQYVFSSAMINHVLSNRDRSYASLIAMITSVSEYGLTRNQADVLLSFLHLVDDDNTSPFLSNCKGWLSALLPWPSSTKQGEWQTSLISMVGTISPWLLLIAGIISTLKKVYAPGATGKKKTESPPSTSESTTQRLTVPEEPHFPPHSADSSTLSPTQIREILTNEFPPLPGQEVVDLEKEEEKKEVQVGEPQVTEQMKENVVEPVKEEVKIMNVKKEESEKKKSDVIKKEETITKKEEIEKKKTDVVKKEETITKEEKKEEKKKETFENVNVKDGPPTIKKMKIGPPPKGKVRSDKVKKEKEESGKEVNLSQGSSSFQKKNQQVTTADVKSVPIVPSRSDQDLSDQEKMKDSQKALKPSLSDVIKEHIDERMGPIQELSTSFNQFKESFETVKNEISSQTSTQRIEERMSKIESSILELSQIHQEAKRTAESIKVLSSENHSQVEKLQEQFMQFQEKSTQELATQLEDLKKEFTQCSPQRRVLDLTKSQKFTMEFTTPNQELGLQSQTSQLSITVFQNTSEEFLLNVVRQFFHHCGQKTCSTTAVRLAELNSEIREVSTVESGLQVSLQPSLSVQSKNNLLKKAMTSDTSTVETTTSSSMTTSPYQESLKRDLQEQGSYAELKKPPVIQNPSNSSNPTTSKKKKAVFPSTTQLEQSSASPSFKMNQHWYTGSPGASLSFMLIGLTAAIFLSLGLSVALFFVALILYPLSLVTSKKLRTISLMTLGSLAFLTFITQNVQLNLSDYGLKNCSDCQYLNKKELNVSSMSFYNKIQMYSTNSLNHLLCDDEPDPELFQECLLSYIYPIQEILNYIVPNYNYTRPDKITVPSNETIYNMTKAYNTRFAVTEEVKVFGKKPVFVSDVYPDIDTSTLPSKPDENNLKVIDGRYVIAKNRTRINVTTRYPIDCTYAISRGWIPDLCSDKNLNVTLIYYVSETEKPISYNPAGYLYEIDSLSDSFTMANKKKNVNKPRPNKYKKIAQAVAQSIRKSKSVSTGIRSLRSPMPAYSRAYYATVLDPAHASEYDCLGMPDDNTMPTIVRASRATYNIPMNLTGEYYAVADAGGNFAKVNLTESNITTIYFIQTADSSMDLVVLYNGTFKASNATYSWVVKPILNSGTASFVQRNNSTDEYFRVIARSMTISQTGPKVYRSGYFVGYSPKSSTQYDDTNNASSRMMDLRNITDYQVFTHPGNGVYSVLPIVNQPAAVQWRHLDSKETVSLVLPSGTTCTLPSGLFYVDKELDTTAFYSHVVGYFPASNVTSSSQLSIIVTVSTVVERQTAKSEGGTNAVKKDAAVFNVVGALNEVTNGYYPDSYNDLKQVLRKIQNAYLKHQDIVNAAAGFIPYGQTVKSVLDTLAKTKF